MLCDTSEASCSDCKMEIIQNLWTGILIKWLNKCVNPNKVCNKLSPACLADIMNKYKNDICDDDIDRAILCTDDIEPFIKYKYPILRLRYLTEDGEYKKKQYIMTSVLLFHCCIKSHSGIVHEDIWKFMNQYEQEVILKFCERLDDMEITLNNVDCAVKEAFDYVKYVQNLSSDDMEAHSSEAHANIAVETEKTPVISTSSDNILLEKSHFTSSVTVLPSVIIDTSTFSSLVTEGEESASSFDQSLNNTDSEEIRSYRANQFAEEKRHRKPYHKDTPEGSLVYKIPEEMSPNKGKNEVKKASFRKRDLESYPTKVKFEEKTRREEPEKYKQSYLEKRGSILEKQEEVLYKKREEILVGKSGDETVMIADDEKHEFAPIRHKKVNRVKLSNEKEKTPKLSTSQLKNKEHTAIRRDFKNNETAEMNLELGKLKHDHSRKTRVRQEQRNEECDIDEVNSAQMNHAVRKEYSSVKAPSGDLSNPKCCACSHGGIAPKDPTDKTQSAIEAIKSPSEDINCTVNKKRAKEESNHKVEQGVKDQIVYTSINRASKFMSKSIQELKEKAKEAWISKKYHLLAAVGLFVLLLGMLITVLILFQPFKKEKNEDMNKSYKRYVRFTSKHTSYQEKHTWICKNKICQIVYNDRYNGSTYSSLSRCNLLCMGPQLWPYPIGYISFSNEIVALATNKLDYKFQSIPSEAVNKYLREAFKLFVSDLERLENVDDGASKNLAEDLTVKKIFIQINVKTDPEPRLKINTEESYNLTIDTVNNMIEVKISSASFCGARHGLQTLSQMILLDQTSGKLITISKAVIKDAPTYKYRGLMIDTARTYIPVEDLLRTIDAMGTVKLNTFHWRISDVTSFPLYLPSMPMLFEYGAYTRSMVYTKEDVKFIVERAGIRGIRVLIEIAAPGPVGRAWSWHPGVNCLATNSGNFTCDNVLCLRLGLKDSIMVVLQTLYSEILEMTNVNDIFHLSDGVFSLSNCYSLIEDRKGFLNMALKQLKAANKGTLPKLPIIWQTPHLHLDFEAKTWEKYGVQVTEMPHDQSGSILSKFKVIHSTKWDLSCEIKNHRCTRYRTWQEMYSWKSWRNIEVFAIEGGETILWTDVVNSGNLDSHLWPRAAAVAERLWSDAVANTSVSGPLYIRLDNQRWRMVLYGVKVQPVWPLWCSLNPARCLEKVR